jgi:hypothetical protein
LGGIPSPSHFALNTVPDKETIMTTVTLDTVRNQADKLGIEYHHRAGADKIAGMVANHLAMHPQDALKLVPSATEEDVRGVQQPARVESSLVKPDDFEKITPKVGTRKDGAPCPVKPLTTEQFHKTEEGKRVKSIGALKRVQIQCMNPIKREWPGEIISVGSARHGTFKKYIPFDGQPYHIPQIIYDVLKDRNCTFYRTEKDARGNQHRVAYQGKEFNVVDLPPLTKKELEQLREKQQMAKAGL